jgi:hypothetical protein
VNLFTASELESKARGIRLRQETAFPTTDSTKLTFTCQRAVELELRLRWPPWAKSGFIVSVNGRPLGVAGQPGSWLPLKRTWQSGDTVSVQIPFRRHTEGFADNPNRFAFLNGPVVLCT